MLRSITNPTWALCLFACLGSVTASTAAFADSHGEPILHIIGSGKGSQSSKASAGKSSKSDTNVKYTKLIRKAAKKHGVPIKIAKAVVQVESNFNPRARGSAGEVGLMQIKPATARGMGYRGSTKALYQPETNLEWGMKYLAGAHDRANGDVCGTILRYNAGHYAKRMNPISRRYCNKVQRILRSS
ncbi:MAG: transglycosylase SLT domain-containing protein [Roseibium sp.]